MQSDDSTTAVNQDEKVTGRDLRNILRRILDGHRIGTGHDGASYGKVREQGDVTGQHGFAFMTKILKGRDGITQVDSYALAHVAANAPLYQQQACARKGRRDQ